MSKSATERKRAERERRKALGLVRVEGWIKPEHVARARKFLAKLS